jgi:hypothetical protein
MDWMQTLVIIGAVWICFSAVYINDIHKNIRQDIITTKEDIITTKEDIIRIKEDIRCMDEKSKKLFENLFLILKEQSKK